jgi:hypothetical protein
MSYRRILSFSLIPKHNLFNTFEKFLISGIIITIFLTSVLGLLAVFLLTLGFDEAWILRGIDSIVRIQAEGLGVAPVISSGGLYAMVQVVVATVFDRNLVAHRLVTFAAFLGSSCLLFFLGKRLFSNSVSALILVSVMVATPGITILAATYATLPAFFVALLVILFWQLDYKYDIQRYIICGLLTGVAAATRFELVFLILSVLIAGIIREFFLEGVDHKISNKIVNIFTYLSLSFTSFILLVLGFRSLTPNEVITPDVEHVARAVGIAQGLLPKLSFKLLNSWIITESYIPYSFFILATLFSIFCFYHKPLHFLRQTVIILTILGWGILIVFVFYSPNLHLRYIWLSIAPIYLVLGSGVAYLYGWSCRNNNNFFRLASLAFVFSLLLTNFVSGIRSIMQGNGDIISFEWERSDTVNIYRPFQNYRDQRDISNYIKSNIPSEEDIGVIDNDYALHYLSKHPIYPLKRYKSDDGKQWSTVGLPPYLLVTPLAEMLTPDAYNWVANNTALEVQFGGYSLYKVLDNYSYIDPQKLKSSGSQIRPKSQLWYWKRF